MTRRGVILIGGTAVCFGVAIFAVSASPREPAREGAAQPVAVPAQRTDLEVLAEAPGAVEPIRTVEVKSRASGEVLRVHVETGDRVEQGQLLAEIDPRDVQNALDQAIADLESAEVQARTTEANRARMEALYRKKVITEQEYETALQAAATASAAVVRARTNLQLAREQRNDVIIRAPIAGTILTDSIEPGQIISSATNNISGGTLLFTMADLSEMQVRTLVDESDIGQIRPGQGAEVTVEAYPGRVFRGEVYKIEPQAVVQQNVTTFPVLVHLPNPQGLLKPGMNAEVSVEISVRRNALVVPNGAVVLPRDAAAAAAALGLDPSVMQGLAPPAEVIAALAPAASDSGSGNGDVHIAAEGVRPAVVFVQGAQGPEPRRVAVGASDWEYTEVVAGLGEGETVLDVTGPQLMQAQQQESERRRPTGGVLGGGRIPGGGG